jgi:hypothetical protein
LFQLINVTNPPASVEQLTALAVHEHAHHYGYYDDIAKPLQEFIFKNNSFLLSMFGAYKYGTSVSHNTETFEVRFSNGQCVNTSYQGSSGSKDIGAEILPMANCLPLFIAKDIAEKMPQGKCNEKEFVVSSASRSGNRGKTQYKLTSDCVCIWEEKTASSGNHETTSTFANPLSCFGTEDSGMVTGILKKYLK